MTPDRDETKLSIEFTEDSIRQYLRSQHPTLRQFYDTLRNENVYSRLDTMQTYMVPGGVFTGNEAYFTVGGELAGLMALHREYASPRLDWYVVDVQIDWSIQGGRFWILLHPNSPWASVTTTNGHEPRMTVQEYLGSHRGCENCMSRNSVVRIIRTDGQTMTGTPAELVEIFRSNPMLDTTFHSTCYTVRPCTCMYGGTTIYNIPELRMYDPGADDDPTNSGVHS